ncbi:MAG: LysR family transcriptional regulator [Pseudomonadota bacterium]
MPRSLPPLAWLRSFECAARRLNVTAAADELALTQSAVSQHIRGLEHRLGVPLFERKPRGLALTDHGRRLLPDVSAALGLLAHATSGLREESGPGLLTVACSVSFAQWYLAPALPRFLDRHPGLRLRMVSTVWPDDFHNAVADVEIRFGPAAVVGDGAERLLPDGLVAVATPEIAADAACLDNHRLIEAVGTADDWRKWSAHSGTERELAPSLFVDSHGLAVDLARQGAGVAVTSALLAAPCLDDGTLVTVGSVVAPSDDGFFLATRAPTSDAALAFTQWLTIEIDKRMARLPDMAEDRPN